MTSQELQIAVAEKMGWAWHYGDTSFEAKKSGKAYWNKGKFDYLTCRSLAKVPPYSTSIDAIQKAAMEKFITSRHEAMFTSNLYDKGIKLESNKYLWQLTAADWCEAFLETCKEIEK